jgi:hypothetical protein
MNKHAALPNRRIHVDVAFTFDKTSARWLALAHEEGKVKGSQARISKHFEILVGPLGFGPPSKDALNVECLVEEGKRVTIRWTPLERTVRPSRIPSSSCGAHHMDVFLLQFHDSICPHLEKKQAQLRQVAAEKAKCQAEEAEAAKMQNREAERCIREQQVQKFVAILQRNAARADSARVEARRIPSPTMSKTGLKAAGLENEKSVSIGSLTR